MEVATCWIIECCDSLADSSAKSGARIRLRASDSLAATADCTLIDDVKLFWSAPKEDFGASTCFRISSIAVMVALASVAPPNLNLKTSLLVVPVSKAPVTLPAAAFSATVARFLSVNFWTLKLITSPELASTWNSMLPVWVVLWLPEPVFSVP